MLSGQEITYIDKDAATEDLQFLKSKIDIIHFSPYRAISKEDFLSKADLLIKGLPDTDSIPTRTFISAAYKIVALIEDRNSYVEWQNKTLFSEVSSYGFAPFLLTSKGDSIICKSSLTKEIKKGESIKTINGQEVTELYHSLRSHIGGNDIKAERKREQFFPIFLFLENIRPPYLIEKGNGDIGYIPSGMDIIKASLMLTNHIPKNAFSFSVLNGAVGLLTYNFNPGIDSTQYFLENSFDVLDQEAVPDLIIDLRNMQDVDGYASNEILKYLAKKKYRNNIGSYWKVNNEMKELLNDSLFRSAFDESFIQKYKKAPDGSILKDISKKKLKPQKGVTKYEGNVTVLVDYNSSPVGLRLAQTIKEFKMGKIAGPQSLLYPTDYNELLEFQMPNSGTYFFLPMSVALSTKEESVYSQPLMMDHYSEGNILVDMINKIKSK